MTPSPTPKGESKERKMNEAQIKHMTERFLNWKLPAGFNPDCGISFDKSKIHPSSWPTGTNLVGYTEAKAMVLHMLEGLPE